jgi:hypothetical protein
VGCGVGERNVGIVARAQAPEPSQNSGRPDCRRLLDLNPFELI